MTLFSKRSLREVLEGTSHNDDMKHTSIFTRRQKAGNGKAGSQYVSIGNEAGALRCIS